MARAIAAMIVLAVGSLNCGICAAASQIPANRTSRKPISASRLPVCCVSAKTKFIREPLFRTAGDDVGSRTTTTESAADAYLQRHGEERHRLALKGTWHRGILARRCGGIGV